MNDLEEPLTRNNFYKGNGGFTLIAVLFVIVILSVLGISILMITSNFMEISAGERNDQSVYYVAEAGVVEKTYDINEKVNEAFNVIEIKYDNLSDKDKRTFDFVGEFYSEVITRMDGLSSAAPEFENNFGNNPTASITLIRKSSNPPKYEIESTGTIGNKKRTVTQEVTVSLNPTTIPGPEIPKNIALYINKTINLSGSVMIYGDVGTKSNNPTDVKFTSVARATGKVHQGVDYSISLPSFPPYPTFNIPQDQKITNTNGNTTDLVKDGKLLISNYITNGYTLNLNKNMEFKEVFLNENNTLIINLGSSDREIVVDHLNVLNGHIKIVGNGKLTIFVKNNITMGSGSTINTKYNGLWDHSQPGNAEKLKIYQKGSNLISLSGDQKVFGSLHAETANIKIGNGGGFQGDIYTGGTEIMVDGGTWVNSQLFLAPNAKFTLGGGGKIKGMVIADSFIGTGGGSLTYDQTNSTIGSGGSVINYGDGTNLIEKSPLIER